METVKKSYKQALLSNLTVANQAETMNNNSPTPSPTANQAGDAIEKQSPMAEKAGNLTLLAHKAQQQQQHQHQGVKLLTIDVNSYLQLPKLEQETQILTNTSLLAKVWGETMEIAKLNTRLNLLWTFVEDDVEFVDRGNHWVEIRFQSQADKEMVWGCRPYHVFGKLLVLKPWIPNFDPREKVKSIDLWLRLIFLPTEYLRKETIEALLLSNGIGRLIKSECYPEKRIKAKYTRVCVNVNVDVTKKLKGYVMLPYLVDGKLELKPYQVWYEDFSEGCGSCGEEDHTFDDCPLNSFASQDPKIVIEKAPPVAKEGKRRKRSFKVTTYKPVSYYNVGDMGKGTVLIEADEFEEVDASTNSTDPKRIKFSGA